MNSFDIDGVIYINKEVIGVYPGPNDIIVTGRSFEEREATIKMLKSRGINNKVFFNPEVYEKKSRASSGVHKANVLNKLKDQGYNIIAHFEDDPIQIEQIKKKAPWIKVIHLDHEYTNKENVRAE